MAVQSIPRPAPEDTERTLIAAATAAPASAAARHPAKFRPICSRARRPRTSNTTRPDQLAGIAEQPGRFSPTRARRAEDRLRLTDAPHGVSVIEIVNDDMPFLVEFGDGRTQPNAASTSAGGPSGLRRGARAAGKLVGFDGARKAAASARASSISMSIASPTPPARRDRRRARRCARRRACRVADWRPMLARVRDVSPN